MSASRRAAIAAALLAGLVAGPGRAQAYPLDGYARTGIGRLEAYRRGVPGTRPLPPGARLETSDIRLRLLERPDFEIPPPDPGLARQLTGFLGGDAAHYGVALLDLTDPRKPRYAEHRATTLLNPGSVGKVVVALALFQALADLYPDDVEARWRVLKETMVTANRFHRYDHHTVPLWKPGDPSVTHRALRDGDQGNLWAYLDWMCSASSNSAAGQLQSEVMLLRKFGRDYPATDEVSRTYFDETKKTELQADLATAMQEPVRRNGLDLARLRQGSFFTRTGKSIVPGTSSHADSRELMRFLVRMEQGKLVDPASSLEIKRLLYLTDRRIRYASAPALGEAAVYFKSGSLFSCAPEEGFSCKKYHGNVKNYMNSVAIVETPARAVPLHYMVVVMSNVLRKNSAVAHQTLATRIHRMMEAAHPVAVEPAG
jgi:hypothetical protein